MGDDGDAMPLLDRFRPAAESPTAPASGAAADVAADRPANALRTAALGGVSGAAVSLAVTLAVVGILGSLAAQASSGWGPIFAMGSTLWLMAGGARVAADGVFVALTPLAGTALVTWVAVRAAHRSLPERGPRTRAYAAWLAGYVLVAAAAVALAASGPATPVWWSLPLPVLGIPALALAIAELPRGHGDRLVHRIPRVLRRAVRPALRTGTVLLLTGMSLLVLAVTFRLGEVGRLYAELDAGVLGSVGLTAGQLLAWPNLGIWAIALVSGPGFAVTEGASVTLGGAGGGVLPLIPVLGAVPSATNFPWFAWLLLLVPVLIGGYAARRTLAEIPRLASTRTKVFSVLSTVALTSIGLGVLDAFAGGSLGDGYLSSVGPSATSLVVSLLLTLGLGALVVVARDWWRLRR